MPRRICSSRFSRPLLRSQAGRVGTDGILAEVVPLRVGNAAIQPLEPSARNPLISKGIRPAPCGLRAIRGERCRREEWPGESERPPRMDQMADQRSPQVSARTRANTREQSLSDEKKPQLRTVGASIVVVECGRRFKSDLQSRWASLSHLSLLFELVLFTSWQPSNWRRLKSDALAKSCRRIRQGCQSKTDIEPISALHHSGVIVAEYVSQRSLLN